MGIETGIDSGRESEPQQRPNKPNKIITSSTEPEREPERRSNQRACKIITPRRMIRGLSEVRPSALVRLRDIVLTPEMTCKVLDAVNSRNKKKIVYVGANNHVNKRKLLEKSERIYDTTLRMSISGDTAYILLTDAEYGNMKLAEDCTRLFCGKISDWVGMQVHLYGLDWSNVENTEEMFKCHESVNVKISNSELHRIQNTKEMFIGCIANKIDAGGLRVVKSKSIIVNA